MSHPILRNRASRKTEILLWTIQGLLAAIFLFAGGMKLVMPIAELTKQMPLPALFLRFIGVAEVSGAFGLILPGALRIRTDSSSSFERTSPRLSGVARAGSLISPTAPSVQVTRTVRAPSAA